MSTDIKKDQNVNREEYLGLHDLKPSPGAKQARKRVGRGHGSGHGKTSGRGHKGFNSRSGGGVRAGYEGGQMPLYMRVGKLRGPNKKMSMPFGPFRTMTQAVNLSRLANFKNGAVVNPAVLQEAGIISSAEVPVKILGHGEIKTALTIQAAGFSRSAREKIEASGGKAEVI